MPIDIICLVVFLFGFWQGYSRGIISTVFTILTYVFGITLAYKMAPTATNILQKIFSTENPMMIVAGFLVNLIFIMFVLRQAAKGMEGVFNAAYLGLLNQLAGGAVVGSFYVLIFSVLLWFANQGSLISETVLNASATYPTLEKLPGRAKSLVIRLKPLALDTWDVSSDWMDRLRDYGVEKTSTKPKVYEIPEDDKDAGIEKDPQSSRPTRRPIVDDNDDGIEDN